MTDTKSKKPLLRHYVSELDLFLKEFDKKPEAYSESRYAEEIKYKKIIELRDNAHVGNETPDLFRDKS